METCLTFMRLCTGMVEGSKRICDLRPVHAVEEASVLTALRKNLHRRLARKWRRN